MPICNAAGRLPQPISSSGIAVDGGAMWSEDDLTYKLSEIIKASAHVWQCEQEGAPAHVISEHEHLLQASVTEAKSSAAIDWLVAVPRCHLYGQLHRRQSPGIAEVWPSGEGYPLYCVTVPFYVG
ncbi:hypothetical protein AZE42_12412 [Rhizopogon vesiculosus]|uniref:Uncharacterized protein n=1 Tax=Rhizopogon vesiculosus TaxID=180088 RepID=A0A1J8QRL5_9AGAM|nr:hypothetical protein AZE42_12412 [Rhizopogon vesiculosus]